MLQQLSLSLSLAHLTTPCKHKHVTFPKAQPKSRPLSPRHGVCILLHTEPPSVSSHRQTTSKASLTPKHSLAGTGHGIVVVCSRNEKMKGGHGSGERKRQFTMAAASRGGSSTHRQQQGRVPRREVLLLGSASRHLLCSPFSWERAFKHDLLGRNMFLVPCLSHGSAAVFWAPTYLWTAPEMHFPPEQASKEVWWLSWGTSVCAFERWEPEQSSSQADPTNCLGKTASRAAEPAAATVPEPVPGQALGFQSHRAPLQACSEQAPSRCPSCTPHSPDLASATSTQNHCPQ